MTGTKIKRATASFQTQGRLLQELGERLVAKANVALMELIKNSFDADASVCAVEIGNDRIVIEDDGHGMTEREFLDNWMHIATPEKQRERRSRVYKRRVTGSKGIGRFAVRFLGSCLRLETVADSEGARSLLSADFDWESIDDAVHLHEVEIPYEVREVGGGEKVGTRLIVTALRSPEDVEIDKEARTELLSLVNPYSGLEAGSFARRHESDKDPGFTVLLPGISGESQTELAAVVLVNAYARLKISHDGQRTKYLIRHRDGRVLVRKTLRRKSSISRGFEADIRYFPRRAGMFRGTEVDGRVAWGWIRDHWGVGIVDHGFRIHPYGFEDDDWLRLSWDSAHNRRAWRVAFMNKMYPMPVEAASQPKLNPMLYLPNLHQLVGAVFVESTQETSSSRPKDLTPSMDREGFVENEAFQELFEFIRGGLEMLAFADHQEQRRLEEERRRKEAEDLRADLKQAAAYLEGVPGLSAEDREAVSARFTTLAKQLDDVEEYYQVTAHKLELMGLLGVMAGFLTHEMQRVLNGLDRVLSRFEKSLPDAPEIRAIVSEIQESRTEIVGQLDYSSAFIGSLHDDGRGIAPVESRAALRLAVRQFKGFAKERGIKVAIEAEAEVLSPPVQRALYNGIVINLLTNALKAAVGGPEANREPRVVLKAWNEPKWHVIEVADTGVGVPPAIRKRIWDPLFTTTAGQDYNPLGSGMGLGLTLVKRVVSDVKGSVALIDPPPGFNTCFRVQLPRRGGGN